MPDEQSFGEPAEEVAQHVHVHHAVVDLGIRDVRAVHRILLWQNIKITLYKGN